MQRIGHEAEDDESQENLGDVNEEDPSGDHNHMGMTLSVIHLGVYSEEAVELRS